MKKSSVLKKFLSYYKPYKFLFFFDLFCALVVSAVDLAFPLILSYVTKSVFTQSKSVILHSIGIIGVLPVFHNLVGTYNGRPYGKRYEA